MAEGDFPAGPGDNPFAGLPMFGEFAKMLGSQGPLNWDAARQFAAMAATGGASEGNPDPAVRMRLQELARIVELHVHDLTGLDTVFPELTAVGRGEWARRTLEAYRPLFTELAVSLGRRDTDTDPEQPADPMMAMMAGLSQMMAPSMMGMAVSYTHLTLPTKA